jgi:hypothetical protein
LDYLSLVCKFWSVAGGRPRPATRSGPSRSGGSNQLADQFLITVPSLVRSPADTTGHAADAHELRSAALRNTARSGVDASR